MPFTKGKSGNRSGKPKGTKSRKTLEWEEFGKTLCALGLQRAMRILKESPDDKFMFYFTNLLEYFKPKLARTEFVDSEADANKFQPPKIVLNFPDPSTNSK